MIWHDFKKTAFACDGAASGGGNAADGGNDRCWACRLGKKLARIARRREKRASRRKERRDGMRETRCEVPS